MTPQEKAHELFRMYGMTIAESIDDEGFICNTEQAKRCALMAVDEVIMAIDWHKFEVPNKEFDFWLNVKSELEKI
jgi:hypothetical protein